MPRRREVPVRLIIPDPKYKSVVLAKLINLIMGNGKKSIAQAAVYQAMDIVEDRTKQDPLKVCIKGIENVKPTLEVRSRRVGGATYQVPIEVRPSRRQTLSLRWLTSAARKRNEHTMAERLANELIDAYNNRGTSIKKKEDTHKMAEANRAFSHYRW